jgi:NhaA family Na+:H+ antiporter
MAVAAALIVPASKTTDHATLLDQLERFIHPISAYLILPIFAFSAAGISFTTFDIASAVGGVSGAIALALALG